MRGRLRGQQNIYQVGEELKDKVDEYGDITGEKEAIVSIIATYKASVSTNEREPIVVEAGVVADYDRVITLYREYNKERPDIKEGDKFFIDVKPMYEDDKVVNEPDYVITKDITTEKGQVFRYRLKKLA